MIPFILKLKKVNKKLFLLFLHIYIKNTNRQIPNFQLFNNDMIDIQDF